MRYTAGQAYYTMSEVASPTGVSAQTVREGERLGYFSARRTAGGHRLFSEESGQTHRWRNSAPVRTRVVRVEALAGAG